MLTMEQRLRMLECRRGPIDLVLDTDAYNEIDDQFAISYTLGRGDKINLKALLAAPFFNDRSTGPADGMEKSYQELLRLLQLTGTDTPALRGSENYLPDEKTPVESDAARHLAQLAMQYTPGKPLYVLLQQFIDEFSAGMV